VSGVWELMLTPPLGPSFESFSETYHNDPHFNCDVASEIESDESVCCFLNWESRL